MDKDISDEGPIAISPTRKPIYMFTNKHRAPGLDKCIRDNKDITPHDRPLSPMCLKVHKAESDRRSSPSLSPVLDSAVPETNNDKSRSKENRSTERNDRLTESHERLAESHERLTENHDRSLLSPRAGQLPGLRSVHPLDISPIHRLPVNWPYPSPHHVFPTHPRPVVPPMSLHGPIPQSAHRPVGITPHNDKVHSPEGARTGNPQGGAGNEATSPGRYTRFMVTDILNANESKAKPCSERPTANDARLAYHGAFRRMFPGFALHLPNRLEPEHNHNHNDGGKRHMTAEEHRKNDHIEIELGKFDTSFSINSIGIKKYN